MSADFDIPMSRACGGGGVGGFGAYVGAQPESANTAANAKLFATLALKRNDAL